MKYWALVAVLLVAAPSFTLLAQPAAGGIHFETGLTWKAIREKAKKENKFIFMDAYTTWCGPCKMMAKSIFPQPQVGSFFNANFINVKVQLDTTKKDDEEVRRWYQDAHDIMVNYSVRVFPTYLFFSPNGELVHRAVGASDAAAFIGKAQNALSPETQYYSLLKKYDDGKKDSAFLRKLTAASIEAYDNKRISEFTNAWVNTQPILLTDYNIRFLSRFVNSSTDRAFREMLANPAAFDKVMGNGYSRKSLRSVIMQEDVLPIMYGPQQPINWSKLNDSLTNKYQELGKEIVSFSRIFYLQQEGNWDEFAKAAVAHMQAYGSDQSPDDLNSLAWAIFQNCNDAACIEQAIGWSKQSLTATNAAYHDTYANLLYKAGKKQEAIEAQEKTVAIAKANNDDSLDDYTATLEKMKKGEKTW
ncbi:MAG: DUF255 domain-containing protein [Chitinophagaceae bacterium]|nr:DUF255 domain-containing protein [Chitinophagaceae bacterium]